MSISSSSNYFLVSRGNLGVYTLTVTSHILSQQIICLDGGTLLYNGDILG